MSKFLEVEVTRQQGTTVFLEVPDGFELSGNKDGRDILAKACRRTCTSQDWDECGWESTVEWQSIKVVPESEARQFSVYKLP